MPTAIADSDVLLVVDVQNDFCPGGKLAVPHGDEVVAPINRLAGRFRHVVLTQDWHPAGHQSFVSSHPGKRPFETVTVDYGQQILWPDHCVQGTVGAQFHDGLQIPHAELVLRKGYHREIDSYSAFYENDRETPPDIGERLQRLIPNAQLHVLRGFDHWSVLTEGQHQLAHRLSEFLERLA